MFRKWIVLIVLCISACNGLPASTPDPMAGTVTLDSPPDGAVIYASALGVSGTLADVAAKPLLVRLIKPDGGVIAQARVEAQQGEWSTEIIHGYTGEPTRVTVEVLPAQAVEAGILASSGIIVASLSERPDGAFINVVLPQDGTEIGGDEVLVMGTASGFPQNQLLVELVDSSGIVLDFETVTLRSRYAIDEIPWELSLTPQAYHGNAVVRVSAEGEVLDTIAVIVTDAAG